MTTENAIRNASIDRFQVSVDALRTQCPPPPAAGDDVSSRTGFGQQRAVDAIRFGMQMAHDGYNIFVLGPLGSHRHGLAQEQAAEHAADRDTPDDWCYVNNFKDTERPAALRFPSGRGAEFREDMQGLIGELRLAIPAAFEGDDYRNQLKATEQETQKEVEELWRSLEEQAAEHGIGVLQTPTGYVLAPVAEGRVIDDKEFDKLPEKKREQIKAAIQSLSETLKARIDEMPKLRKRLRERVRALDQEVVSHAVSLLLNEVRDKYRDLPQVSAYLDDIERNIVDNAQDFRQPETQASPFARRDSTRLFSQYEVNLLVTNQPGQPAPVVYETNPSYPNLIGKIEHRAEMGALVTDFRMVRAGALLRANGGYLILDARRVLERPFVWEALKQTLFARRLTIESPGETYGLVSTTTLKPEPIPLDVKIVLIGERWLYYLLCHYDAEFNSLFKVAADLDDDVERSDDNIRSYINLIAHRIREGALSEFSAGAIQRVVEERARRAEDSERLSMHMRSLDDLLVQADHCAKQRDSAEVTAADVAEALRQNDHRLSRIKHRTVDAIKRDTLLIDTAGACVGQVNGLAVSELGEYSYGHPLRITATTRVGTGEVVDIEREVELGGAIHSKGMMILSAALSARYAPEVPLSLQGSVVFEQSYGGVEGDSASVAELCALLSSLSGVPIRQSFAVTGSINQLGRVQVVGGINEKVEGFFDVCKERGLDGSHGVVIPHGNVKHLMLREDVVEAVRDGRFAVYAAADIDEAATILTGIVAGERDAEGKFPEGSINRRVEDRLIAYAQSRKDFSDHEADDEPQE